MSTPHRPPGSGELSPGDDSAPKRGTSVLTSILVISVGAALGALLRWYLAARFNQIFPQLPPGTLAANLLGGYLIGIAMAVFLAFPALSPQWRLLTVTGFLWALSTIASHVIGSVAMTLLGVFTVRGLRSFF
jgi:CrcB protein